MPSPKFPVLFGLYDMCHLCRTLSRILSVSGQRSDALIELLELSDMLDMLDMLGLCRVLAVFGQHYNAMMMRSWMCLAPSI